MGKHKMKHFFYIIPRTGSTSLTATLQDAFPGSEFLCAKIISETYDGRPITAQSSAPFVARLRDQLGESTARCFAIMGPYGLHQSVQGDVRCYTTLREPVDRVVSMWRFMRKTATLNPLHEEVSSFGDDIAQALRIDSTLCFANEQVRMLSGSAKMTMDQDDLAAACRTLDSCNKVFLFGYFDYLAAFIGRISSTSSINYPQLNAAPRDIALHADVLGQIRAQNSLDQKLFEYALARQSKARLHPMSEA